MKAIASELSVVVVGAFNPAILHPQWVTSNCLGYAPNAEYPVEMMAPIASDAPRRLRFEGLSYTASPTRLIFHLGELSRADRDKSIAVCGQILHLLPHTPVSALGMNFGFSIERPPVELLDLFSVSAAAMDCLSEEAKVSTRRWANVFADEDFQLALDAEESGDAVRLKMNFHYSTPSAAMAAAVLSRPGLFERHWGTSLAMAKSLSNQDLEESNAYD